jgi:hypothetical protein
MPTSKSGTRKAKAMSLHIGLNAVDPKHYGGWSGPLAACEADANDMAAIAAAQGIAATKLLTKAGTRKAVLGGLRKAAATLDKGDYFLLTYSGHGGQVADANRDETDGQDETWCLYDGQLIDDELYAELGAFKVGVRILVLSDSCHSGTVTRARIEAPPAGGRSKAMPPDVALRVYAAHKAFYDGLQNKLQKSAGSKSFADPDAVLSTLTVQGGRVQALARKIGAAVILVSGCQDNQTSMDGDHNGAFTGQLRRVWNNGRFTGNHARFHSLIRAGLPPSQTPNLFVLGDAGAFLAQKPFTV